MKQQHRMVRSFVRREGRMTARQSEALSKHWAQYGLDVDSGSVSFEEIFGRDAPANIEIGFGMGISLLQAAIENPQHNFIGIEVYRPGVGALLADIEQQDITNIRIFQHDAVEVLTNCIPENGLDKVMIFFPDPWPKKRHHKRRLIQPEFIDLICTRLKLGGILHLATDWHNYADHMMQVLSAEQRLANKAGKNQFIDGSQFRSKTKFERRGIRLGHQIWDLVFERVNVVGI